MSDHGHPVNPNRIAAARDRLVSVEEAERVSGLIKLIGDPIRTRMLYALSGVEELCVGDIALAIDAPESSVSYGLRLLRTAGVVRNRREGRMIYYRLVDGFMGQLLEVLRQQAATAGRAQ